MSRGYNGNGQMTGLTTFQSNTVNGAGAATTTWAYDPASTLLQSKTYADQSKDTFKYNAAGQLKTASQANSVTTTYGYSPAGQQTSFSASDSSTGVVGSTSSVDDQGRPLITTNTDNGKTFTTTDAYTTLGELKTETLGSAGNATVGYTYFPTTGYPSNGSPDALQTLTVTTPAGQTVAQGYGYNSTAKRLQTITANGVTITYGYLADSNQLASVTVGNVTTTFTPDSADPSRLGAMSVTAGGVPVYDATYGYNPLDQRTRDTVTRTTVDDAGNTSSVDASRGYTYDAAHDDALAAVQDGQGNTIENYGYDGAGNRTTDNGNVRAANPVNQLAGYQVNDRGEVADDGTYTLKWDALNRPIDIAPKAVVLGSYDVKLGYDAQGRWLWKDVYQWDGSAWAYAYSRRAVYDGGNLIGEQDANGTLLKGYTWGPNGRLELVTDYTRATPKSYVPIADASGNYVMLVDPLNGSVVASYSYDAYGRMLSASGPMKGLLPFLGKGLYVHAELPGLMFAQHRITDGRTWYSRDPSGEPSDENLYRTYGGDPIDHSDPSGLDWKEYISIFAVPKAINAAEGWLAEQAKAAAENAGYSKTATVLGVGVSLSRAVRGTVNNTDWTTPVQFYRHVEEDAATGENWYQLRHRIGTTDATIISAESQLPVTGSVVRGYEAGWDVNLTYAPAFSQSVGPQGKSDRWTGITIEAIMIVAPVAVKGFGAVRDPAFATDAATDPIITSRQALIRSGMFRSGHVINPLTRATAARAARAAAMTDMMAEDLAEIDPSDRPFYNAPHNNSLQSLAPARGYMLVDIDSGEPLAYGTTTRGTARYVQAQLRRWNARMVFVAEGSVAEVRAWETKQILDYLASRGERPPMNQTNH